MTFDELNKLISDAIDDFKRGLDDPLVAEALKKPCRVRHDSVGVIDFGISDGTRNLACVVIKPREVEPKMVDGVWMRTFVVAVVATSWQHSGDAELRMLCRVLPHAIALKERLHRDLPSLAHKAFEGYGHRDGDVS